MKKNSSFAPPANTPETPVFSFENLSVGYQKHTKNAVPILSNLQFSMAAGGGLTALVGSNGVGKTTLLRTLCGLQPAIAGAIYFGGKPISAYSPQALAAVRSFVSTERIAVPYLTVWEVLCLGRVLFSDNQPKARRNVLLEIAERTRITSLLPKSMHQLSDGERQKVMIARALAQNTPIVFLDEPTAHLDLQNRCAIFELLRELTRPPFQKNILLATHELELAVTTADTLLLLTHDRRFWVGKPAELVQNGAMAQLFDDHNALLASYLSKVVWEAMKEQKIQSGEGV